MRRTTIAVALAGLCGASLTIMSPAHAGTACPAVSDTLTVAAAEALGSTCDLTGVTVHSVTSDVSVVVPALGEIVAYNTDGELGGKDFELAHYTDGSVSVTEDSDGSKDYQNIGSGPGLPACQDNAYRLATWTLVFGYGWYYNPANQRGGSTALNYIYAGTTNLAKGYNNCNLNVVKLPQPTYYGTTTRVANELANGCGTRDNYNTASWVNRGANAAELGGTCTWADTMNHGVVESDMELNYAKKWFLAAPPTVCNAVFDVQSVTTHERGHTYGLNHPDLPNGDHVIHDNLTMNSVTDGCSTRSRTLGLGDVRGLDTRY